MRSLSYCNGPAVQSAGFVAIVSLGLMAPDFASAQFAVCNQSFDVLNVAIGQFTGEVFETLGWWTIGPNQCANVITDELTARYVYVFAQDVFGKTVISGAKPMCVAPDRFVIRGHEDCLVRGLIEARFLEVDTEETERWTLFVNPPLE